MSDSFSRDLVNQLREMGAVDPRDAEIERLKEENGFLKELMDQRTTTIRNLEAERDEARAEIERLTKAHDTVCGVLAKEISRAEKAEAERDKALARVARANRMSASGYSAGVAAGVNAAVAAYEAAMGKDAHKYGIDQMLDLLAVPTPSPETESDDYASAVKERDEARAQVAAAYEAAAKVIPHASGTLVGESLGQRLCCNGYMCGCQGATVGLYLQHLIRALTPADAKAALEAYVREKARDGVHRVIDRLRHEGQINPSLTYADAIEWAEYVLNEMETPK